MARDQWGRSIIFRTTLLAVGATVLATSIAFAWAGILIHNDLFERRLDEVQTQAARAVASAQARMNEPAVTGDGPSVHQVMASVRELDLQRLGGTNELAYFRPQNAEPEAPSNFATEAFRDQRILVESGNATTPGETIPSKQLRQQVRDTEQQWWQSVSLPTSGGSEPGIVVGSKVTVPDTGVYEVYLAYDLRQAEQTLRFVQATLWIAGGTLVLLVAAISWLVLRTITRPVVEVARTSERFAAGDLEARLEVRGMDELATLSRSFNTMADGIESQITELAELSQVQQRFVSDVSHELRTPLTTIRMASTMISDQRDDFDPPTARAAELLHEQVERFDDLLGDLLEISRYDAGSASLELEPTNLAALAEEVVDGMRQIAEQHDTELRVVAPGGHTPADVDRRRIRRILRNLVGNAIEHSDSNPVVVTVDSNAWAVALGVRDTGVGMTQESVAHVFDRFWRAEPSRQRTLGGTGLGLAIALGDAELHGGALDVWSEIGVGTHFVLTLPRDGVLHRGASPIALGPATQPGADLGATQPITALVREVST